MIILTGLYTLWGWEGRRAGRKYVKRVPSAERPFTAAERPFTAAERPFTAAERPFTAGTLKLESSNFKKI